MNFEEAASLIRRGHWYELSDKEAGAAVTAVAASLWSNDTRRRTEFNKTLKRFGSLPLRGLFMGSAPMGRSDDVRLNLTKAVVETLVAKVGSNRPRPKILTDGANFSLRTRAKKLQKFLDGIYQTADVYRTCPMIFRDALLGGTGVTYFYPDVGNRKVCAERVFPFEILVDPVEAINGNPQTIYRVKFMDKDTLKRMFPKKRHDIEEQAAADENDLPEMADDVSVTKRMVMVVEGWKLAGKTYEGDDVPGKHVLAVGSLTLTAEDYNEQDFPFSFFHWSAPVRGFWGDSAVAEIRGIEKEVNRLLQHIQKSMKLAGMPWVMSPNGSNVKIDEVTNRIAQIVKYDGPEAPHIQTFQVAHPQMFEHCWQLYGKAFAILGTNELQAAAIKPPGIDSGRGLEQLSEEHLVRFKHVAKDFEDIVGRQYAEQFVRCAVALDESLREQGVSGGYVLKARGNDTQVKLVWKDCAIGSDDFFLQVWPTSVLPLTPSGKTEEVERWQANGWITPERAQELLDFPDLESERNLATADCELLDWQLERMIDEGEDVAPEPRQNLQYALQRGTYALEFGIREEVPLAHLDCLRNFLDACQDLLAPPPPPDAMLGGPAGVGAMGAPPPPAPGLAPSMGAPAGIAPPMPGTMIQ